MSKIDVVLLCGGKGTRFAEVTGDTIPKSLYEANGRELIDYTLSELDYTLIGRLIFALDHQADAMEAWAKAREFPCEVVFSRQTKPGVLGAVNAAVEHVDARGFAVCNTDEVRHNFSLSRLVNKHQQDTAGHLATMTTTMADEVYRHRVIEADPSGHIAATSLKNLYYKEHPEVIRQINVGFILFDTKAIGHFDSTRGDGWSSMIDPLVEQGLMQASLSEELTYFNVGTQAELESALTYLVASE